MDTPDIQPPADGGYPGVRRQFLDAEIAEARRNRQLHEPRTFWGLLPAPASGRAGVGERLRALVLALIWSPLLFTVALVALVVSALPVPLPPEITDWGVRNVMHAIELFVVGILTATTRTRFRVDVWGETTHLEDVDPTKN